MSPVPSGHVWALTTVGSKRHIVLAGKAYCSPKVTLGLSYNTPQIMATPACKRCLVKTGGAQ